jgi:hypothetical protein
MALTPERISEIDQELAEYAEHMRSHHDVDFIDAATRASFIALLDCPVNAINHAMDNEDVSWEQMGTIALVWMRECYMMLLRLDLLGDTDLSCVKDPDEEEATS